MLTSAQTPGNGPAHAVLTAASRKEQALWLLEKLVPSGAVNNLSVVFTTEEPLGEWELQQTLDALVRRHPALRTVFHGTDGGLVKQTVPADRFAATVSTMEVAAGGTDAAVAALVARPFTFDGQPLLRAGHLQGPEGDVFCLVVHHIVFDTVSAAILLDEFTRVYEAVAAGLDVPEDLAAPQPALATAAPTDESLAYWREHLKGFDPSALGLDCGTEDRPDPTLTGDSVLHTLSAEAHEAVRRLQREVRAPEAVVLLAAYYLLLARHGAGPDLVVGSPANVRPAHAAGTVGYHVNTLPLRARVDLGAGFRTLAAEAREAFFGAITHADVPVDVLLPEIEHTGATWRNTVFRHLFNYVPNAGLTSFDIDGVPARRLLVENGYSKFDLEFFFLASPEEIRVRGVFYTEVLSRDDTEFLLERYDALLVALGQDPDRPLGELPLHGARDRAVIDTANATGTEITPATLLEAVAATVAATPGAVAIEDGAHTTTYQQLWDTALADRDLLRAAGARPGDIVALAARRGPQLAAAVLGAWLAGTAYLALDPDHPAQRTAYLLEDSGAAVVLAAPGIDVAAGSAVTVEPMAAVAPATPSQGTDPTVEEPVDLPAPDATAFLIYTSGSTGKPKGTVITHRGAANVIHHFRHELGAGAADVTLWLTTFTFDISALELFLPLVTGGRIAVAPEAARSDGQALLDVLERHDVGIIQATPTTWRLIADKAGHWLAGRRGVTGGEPMPPALARRITAAGCTLRNAYAPSETTIYSTCGTVPEGATAIDIGRPMNNTRAFITDPDGRELPIGVRGELCIAGTGVALGYHGRPELTAERFATHPEHGRYYRTGDLACWLPDGRLALHGRADRQVKLRGNRIELGEVEAVLLEHPQVRGVAVVVDDEAPGGPLLVAFVEPAQDTGPAALADLLWEHARAGLPGAAVPQEFLAVDTFPATVSQKTDYLALKRLAGRLRNDRGTDTGGTTHQGDELTVALIALWQQLLERTDIDADANFFAHGGHSLLGAQLVQRVEDTTGTTLAMADLYADPTPARLAARIRKTNNQ
ncbi:amino acid adenylation domain-containing protein [Streptomyces sp. SID2563]|uniref:non-ribosomal peptide synthetase n=1 Tax=Streptomyces sp. SID2563 TaxID=2690255 RepID=UPI0013722C91|nr:non-ribosomal peptide synthetase [Streptomyces sp. SID2563]MYW07604.1 amino acid adenylation domain-containing protein [Streptomyces sp. SID2563]